MKMKFSSLIVLFCCTVTLFGQSTFDQAPSLKAATAFLATLTPAQKTVANLAFSDSSRTKWSNLPLEQVYRQGIQFKDLADYDPSPTEQQYTSLNFQIKLFETANHIEFLYGSFCKQGYHIAS